MALDKLVVHSTETPYGIYIPIEDLHDNHIIKGYGKIGFADVIHFDGLIESTLAITNGEKPYDWGTPKSRHIAYMGGLSRDGFNIENTMTAEQQETLYLYIQFIKRRHPNVKIVDYSKTKLTSFQ